MNIIDQKDLSSYLKFAEEQASQFPASDGPLPSLAKRVDEFLRKTWDVSPELEPTSMFLLLNSYFLWMASLRTATTGHVAAVFPVVRAALESSCYAFHMSRDSKLAAIWINREANDDARKQCRRVFTSAVTEVSKQMRQEGHESVSELVMQSYETTITYGAHPNSASVFKHMASRPDDGGDFWKFDLTCMYGHDSFETQHAVFACIEYGLVLAAISIVIHKEHVATASLVTEFHGLHTKKEQLIEELGWKIRAGM